jgi:hypothetical protein
VHLFGPAAHAEQVTELPQPRVRESVAGGQPRCQRDGGWEALAVLRVARPVATRAFGDARVGRGVDLVRVTADRRQAAREERLAHPVRRLGEVAERRVAAEALPDDAPPLDAEALRNASASRTIASARKSVRYAACSIGVRPPSVAGPTGVERPVPRWSTMGTR